MDFPLTSPSYYNMLPMLYARFSSCLPPTLPDCKSGNVNTVQNVIQRPVPFPEIGTKLLACLFSYWSAGWTGKLGNLTLRHENNHDHTNSAPLPNMVS